MFPSKCGKNNIVAILYLANLTNMNFVCLAGKIIFIYWRDVLSLKNHLFSDIF